MLLKKTILALATIATLGIAGVAGTSTAAFAWDGNGNGGGNWGERHHRDHGWGGERWDGGGHRWGGYCHWEQRPVKVWTNWGFDWRYENVKICGY